MCRLPPEVASSVGRTNWWQRRPLPGMSEHRSIRAERFPTRIGRGNCHIGTGGQLRGLGVQPVVLDVWHIVRNGADRRSLVSFRSQLLDVLPLP